MLQSNSRESPLPLTPRGVMGSSMLSLVFDESRSLLELQRKALPALGPGDALVRVHRSGICSTDLEITRGYVPGYCQALGHEFVGVVEQCPSQPLLVGKRVCGEINCNICNFSCADAIFTRNHSPGRQVLGIIKKDGCMAEYVTLPIQNLHIVPDSLTDQEACYAEPLAAACRVIEQKAIKEGDKIAVIGDGKLGLLVAAVLAIQHGPNITLFGRHARKMAMVREVGQCIVVRRDDTIDRAANTLDNPEQHEKDPSSLQQSPAPENGAACQGDEHGNSSSPGDQGPFASQEVAASFGSQFDVCVEASGSSGGIRLALALLRPLGTLVLKSTVSLKDDAMPGWSEIANDLVVNEKVLVGSRCGPIDVALQTMAESEDLRSLLNGMTEHVLPLSLGVEAMKTAAKKGVLKVQLVCSGQSS